MVTYKRALFDALSATQLNIQKPSLYDVEVTKRCIGEFSY